MTSNEGNSRQSPLPASSVANNPTVKLENDDSSHEVDDHFAKALGNDTWKMIQEKEMDQ